MTIPPPKVEPRSALRAPHSAFPVPRSALRTPRSALRVPRSDAAAAALATIQAAFATNPGLPSSAFHETATALAQQIAEGGGSCAETPERLASVLPWQEAAGGPYLKRLAVRPEHRRRGLAHHLLQAAAEETLRRGLPRLWLRVRADLHGNLRLCARAGFREMARLPHERDAAPLVAVLERRAGSQGPRWGGRFPPQTPPARASGPGSRMIKQKGGRNLGFLLDDS